MTVAVWMLAVVVAVLTLLDLGLVGSVLGRPGGSRAEHGAWRTRTRLCQGSDPVASRPRRARGVRVGGGRYRDSGAEEGPLGNLRSDHRPVGDRSGQIVRCERGSIHRQFGGRTSLVLTRTDPRDRKLGGPRGRLGYPTSDTVPVAGSGSITRFERGVICMSPRTDAIEFTGRALTAHEPAGGVAGPFGFPVTPMRRIRTGGRKQRFEGGLLIGPGPDPRGGRAGAHPSPLDGRDARADRPVGPRAQQQRTDRRSRGLWNAFDHAIVYWSPATGVHWFSRGPLYTRYRHEGGAQAGWASRPPTSTCCQAGR